MNIASYGTFFWSTPVLNRGWDGYCLQGNLQHDPPWMNHLTTDDSTVRPKFFQPVVLYKEEPESYRKSERSNGDNSCCVTCAGNSSGLSGDSNISSDSFLETKHLSNLNNQDQTIIGGKCKKFQSGIGTCDLKTNRLSTLDSQPIQPRNYFKRIINSACNYHAENCDPSYCTMTCRGSDVHGRKTEYKGRIVSSRDSADMNSVVSVSEQSSTFHDQGVGEPQPFLCDVNGANSFCLPGNAGVDINRLPSKSCLSGGLFASAVLAHCSLSARNQYSTANVLQSPQLEFPFCKSTGNVFVNDVHGAHTVGDIVPPRPSPPLFFSGQTSYMGGTRSAFKPVTSSKVKELLTRNIFSDNELSSRRESSNSLKSMETRTDNRPYKCECGRTFARNEELTRHRRIHSGYKPHQCRVCAKLFGRKDHLNKHLKTHLRTSEKKTHLCTAVPGCKQSYTRSDALTRHKWTAHGIAPRSSKWRPRRCKTP